MTVSENVYLNGQQEVIGEAGNEIVGKALVQAGVMNQIKSLPKGTETTLMREFDDEGAVLSEGNAQKVIVARAFAKAAPIQVYDEPSSALDPIAEYDLYKSIMQASIGNTTLFVSHRLSSVADADVIFVLEHGSVIEKGNHGELMDLDGEYAKMFSMQARSYLADEGVGSNEKVD